MNPNEEYVARKNSEWMVHPLRAAMLRTVRRSLLARTARTILLKWSADNRERLRVTRQGLHSFLWHSYLKWLDITTDLLATAFVVGGNNPRNLNDDAGWLLIEDWPPALPYRDNLQLWQTTNLDRFMSFKTTRH
jgi:hypothetical protein